MGELNQIANASGLTIVSGGQHGVGYGGFAGAGGHSALGPTFGMAADNIFELEVVTPSGDILTVNECENQDLFWALRGVSKSPSICQISQLIVSREEHQHSASLLP